MELGQWVVDRKVEGGQAVEIGQWVEDSFLSVINGVFRLQSQ